MADLHSDLAFIAKLAAFMHTYYLIRTYKILKI